MPAIAAFGAAAAAFDPAWNQVAARLKAFAQRRLATVRGAVLLEEGVGDASPYILGLSLPGYKSEVVLHFLAARGVYVSSGSACAKGKGSHVLGAMGLGRGTVDSFIRVSFSHENTEEEVEILARALADAVSTLATAGTPLPL